MNLWRIEVKQNLAGMPDFSSLALRKSVPDDWTTCFRHARDVTFDFQAGWPQGLLPSSWPPGWNTRRLTWPTRTNRPSRLACVSNDGYQKTISG
jgi:hypothetical protein